MRVLIYARLSQDRSGRSENVEIQKAECTEYAERKGWKVVGTFEDNDLSASKFSTKPRLDYDAMLHKVRANRGDVVLVTEMPRLYRRMEELLELIRLAETTSLEAIQTTAGVGSELRTPEGVHAAITSVSVAMMESARLSERGRRKKAVLAQRGQPHGGPRCFGYEPTGMTIRESEAALIRDAAEQLLNGKPALQSSTRWRSTPGGVSRGRASRVSHRERRDRGRLGCGL